MSMHRPNTLYQIDEQANLPHSILKNHHRIPGNPNDLFSNDSYYDEENDSVNHIEENRKLIIKLKEL